MEHQINDELTPTNPKALKSRRELLKALTATGGAVTASALLSGQWMKPVVEVGLLPVHAQASGPLTANSLTPPGSTGLCYVEQVTAIMSPPQGGVAIQMVYQKLSGPDPVPGPTIVLTNGAGVADFTDVFSGFDAEFNLVFSFVDTATYGSATFTLGPFTGTSSC